MSDTQQTLAQMIRAKYPHTYDDLDDSTLEKNVLAKYPQYSDMPQTKPKGDVKFPGTDIPVSPVRIPPESRGRPEEGATWEDVKSHAKTAAEIGGSMVGSEFVSGARGLIGVIGRMIGSGVGAGAANVGAQAIQTGKVDPTEALKTAGGFAAGEGAGEAFGAGLNGLRSSLGRMMYTDTGDLTPVAKAVVHPTELPEIALRKAIPLPPEVAAQAEAAAQAKVLAKEGKAVPITKSPNFDSVAYKAGKTGVPQPKPSPFGDATSSAPQAPTMITDSNGIRYVTASDGMKVSIPKSVADADAISYAGPKLAEQRQILSSIKSRPDMPQGNPTPFPTVQKLSDLKAGGTADDLISRTKKIVRPGEAPTAEDLKRAGDLTQVPLAKLRQLAAWGDELAKNELVRRLRMQ